MSTATQSDLPAPPASEPRRSATVRVLLLTLLPVVLYVSWGFMALLFRRALSFDASRAAAALVFGTAGLGVAFATRRSRAAHEWARIVSLLLCGYIALMAVLMLITVAL